MICTSDAKRASGVRSVASIASLAVLAATLVACGGELEDAKLSGEIGFQPERPSLGAAQNPERYTGTNATVLEAQERLGTGLELHRKVVHRTCGPDGGVCHNSKEYPDLHTPANFLGAIGAPCNVQPGGFEAVFDRCERPGDRLELGGRRRIEIG
jgi:hypothetical protein